MTLGDFLSRVLPVGVTLSVLSFVGGACTCRTYTCTCRTAGTSPRRRARARGYRLDMPFFNFATITAFLAWFGGTGYLLTRYSALMVTLVMLVAIVSGWWERQSFSGSW